MAPSTCDGGANYTNYCNPAYDKIMDQAATISDQSQRATLYEQAQTIYLTDIPIMIAYRNATAYAWSSKLSGVALYGDPSAMFYKIDQWVKTP